MFFRRRSSFTDNDLLSVIEACRTNDVRAQRTLFRQYYSYAKSVCLRYMANVDEADDVLNESFLKVFQHLGSYDTSLPFKAWLRTIVVNTTISYHRKHHKLDTVSLSPVAGNSPPPDLPVHETAVDQLAAEEILALVQQLPPIHRTVFLMHVVDGYSLREVADNLNANEATVRSHFLRARVRLQELVTTASSSSKRSSQYYEN
ncbi:RNA polymerase sigma factor [Fibrivirga algicola]|uniref:RNA polymerase sigma factor n=1 Tax=Fibrivirga algicola TaxID=2950420 RepID=A0ABX0Q9H8_9BACT|nr:RNA polymerase sigma factor [Fibrivirga algicola]ARK09089.1 RNA polymerase subunit sigma-70 [Fibrella sp. ES10-3-2-2]NID08801.1 RNA polymerase sigma factor [Fibrivirga algicola]